MKQKFTESSWAIFSGIRFLLALIVMVRHLIWFAGIPARLNPVILLGGRAAVLGFLLISGISIGHSYRQQPNGYYKRRFLRIYPLYFSAVVITEVVTLSVGSPCQLQGGFTLIDSGWETPLANLFFFQGLFSNPISYNNPLWTIAVEVFLYLLVPLFSKLKLEILLLLIAVSMVTFCFFPKSWYFEYISLRYAWPWLIGFVYATRGGRLLTASLLLIGVAAIFFIRTDVSEPLSWLTFSVVSIVALYTTTANFSIPKICQNILNAVGEYSYPLYLLHMPLCITLYHYFGVRNAWKFIIFVIMLVIPLNYIFDRLLKAVFWKPLTIWAINKVKSAKQSAFSHS